MMRSFTRLLPTALPLATGLATAALSGEKDARPLPAKLAPFFRPPAEFADDFGSYKSPLKFDDGSAVKTPADWAKRRQEILKTWHDALGTWPPLLEKPKIEYVAKERRGTVTQHKVKIEGAPGRFTDDACLLVPDGDGPFPAVVVVFYEANTGVGRSKYERLDYA